MVFNCNVPSLNGLDSDAKLKKMEKYLYELENQLRYVLSNLDVDNFTVETKKSLEITKEQTDITKAHLKKEIESMKNRIIATASEIDSHIESIRNEMSGYYTAVSDRFGEYNAQFFKETVESVLGETETYSKIENINGKIIVSSGYIKTGDLGITDDSGQTLYGIEIGDVNTVNGFKLRLIKNKISFIEKNQTVAYITGQEIVIAQARITDYVYFGNFRTEVVNGVAWLWEG